MATPATIHTATTGCIGLFVPGSDHASIGAKAPLTRPTDVADPSDDEIDAAAGKLRQAGTGGWLAVLEGNYPVGERRRFAWYGRSCQLVGAGKRELPLLNGLASLPRHREAGTPPPTACID